MSSQYSKILNDAGWILHKVEPELTSGYVVHQATGQIVYLEFYGEDDGYLANHPMFDDRAWEGVEALVTKKIKFDSFYRTMEM